MLSSEHRCYAVVYSNIRVHLVPRIMSNSVWVISRKRRILVSCLWRNSSSMLIPIPDDVPLTVSIAILEMSAMVIEGCRGVAACSKLFEACSHPTTSVRSWRSSPLHRHFFWLLSPGWLRCIPIFCVCMCWSAPHVSHIHL